MKAAGDHHWLLKPLARAENGTIIVVHFDNSGTRTTAAVILGDLIDAVRARRLEPVTTTELIGE